MFKHARAELHLTPTTQPTALQRRSSRLKPLPQRISQPLRQLRQVRHDQIIRKRKRIDSSSDDRLSRHQRNRFFGQNAGLGRGATLARNLKARVRFEGGEDV